MTELQQQLYVIHLIKGLAEVHYDDISLTAFIKRVRDILDELYQLGFTAEVFYGNRVSLDEEDYIYPDRP
ncbi:MAG: hypothetical protein JAY84_18780 [Candidatus Thiodiazotropha taylori]|nr:hypothetical protein [Candidatus Thiodiazotropha taylori]